MRQKVAYPFDVARFRREEGLTLLTFAEAIGKSVRRVEALESGKTPGLTSREHGSLCRRFGRGKVSLYYDLAFYATKS